MSELSDYKKHVSGPLEESLRETIRDLRERLRVTLARVEMLEKAWRDFADNLERVGNTTGAAIVRSAIFPSPAEAGGGGESHVPPRTQPL